MRPVLMFLFGELPDIPPSDRVGTVGDLGVEPGIVSPLAVQGWTGRGRRFVPSSQHGLFGRDNDGRDSLLTRNCTIQSLLAVDLSASAGVMTLVSRGLDGSASEYYAYGVELQAGAIAGDIDVRWFWAGRDGTIFTTPSATYHNPGDGETVLLTCTRRWESSLRVVVRFYVADKMIGEFISFDGDIGGGTLGHLSIGARKTGGAWGRYFSGVVEQLVVYDYELSQEEIEAQWRRLAVHQRDGEQRMRLLSPPGEPWSMRPDSSQGRATKQAGQILALPAALAEESRNLLPDRCYQDMIERWERLVGLSPRPLDSLDTRRLRVIAFLSRENGFALPIIRRVMAPVLDLIPTDVEIMEFTNTVYEPFDALRPERWHVETPSAWSISSGMLRVQLAAGSSAPVSGAGQVHARMSFPTGERGAAASGPGALCQVQIGPASSWPSTATNLIAGIFWWDGVSDDCLFAGVTRVGSDYAVAYRTRTSGVTSAVTVAAVVGAYPNLFIRTRRTGASQMTLEFNTTGLDQPVTTATFACSSRMTYAGVGVSCDGAFSGLDLDIAFDEFTLHAPAGLRVFRWFVFRNPALPQGQSDLVGARLLIQRYKPAHTYADVITSKSLLCDSLSSVCDGGPMGGF